MENINLHAITTDKINHPGFTGKDIEINMLRLDKIHPLVSGNKWFKLRYYIQEAQQQNKKKIVTFGGAWSNHIVATAAACRLHHLSSAGIIRGEKPARLSATLQEAQLLGMELFFTPRNDFSKAVVPDELASGDNIIIPQGGYGEPGAKGAADILKHAGHKDNYTHICCATGTGTMLAGLIRSACLSQKVIGISVLKNNFRLEQDVQYFLQPDHAYFSIIHDYHFGGYAKQTNELIRFMNEWYATTGIPTDFVYTAKLCFAVTDLIKNDFFPASSRILLIHSGGLTGNASLKNGTLIF